MTGATAGTAGNADAEPSDAALADSQADEGAKAEVTEEELRSPVNGKVIPLTEVTDETFASEMLGTTVAVEPEDGRIVAPCDGEVLNVFDTGHAVCLTTQSGGELLIHVGVDTVKLEGKGFTKKVSDGAKVHAGDVLIEADLDTIRNAGYPATTMVILTNADEYSEVKKAEPGVTGTDKIIMNLKK